MSYLEQSTRYIAYDARLGGRYRYYRDPEVLGVAARHPLRRRHGPAVRHLRRAAARTLQDFFRERYPKDADDSDFVYRQAIRAKAFDAAPGHPAGGVAVQRRHLRHRPGLRGAAAAHAGPPAARGPRLRRPHAHRAAQGHPVVPEAGRPAPTAAWPGATTSRPTARRWTTSPCELFAGDEATEPAAPTVTLVDFDPDGEVKLVAAMLYPHTDLPETQHRATGSGPMSADDRLAVVRAYVGERANRRHKPGRALERTDYRFDVAGRLRRLPRPAAPPHAHHRVAGAHARATATPGPSAVDDAGARRPLRRGHGALGRACTTTCSERFPAQAAYAVSLAYKVRFVMQMNAREAMHLIELRTTPQGHPAYRLGRPGDAPPHRRAGRPPRRRRDDALRRPHAEPDLERLEAERRAEARRASVA